MDRKNVTGSPLPLFHIGQPLSTRCEVPPYTPIRRLNLPLTGGQSAPKVNWLNDTSDRILAGIAAFGAWADRHLGSDESVQSTLGTAGSIAQAQANLNSKYVSEVVERLRVVPGWTAADVERHFPGENQPRRFVRTVAKLGAAADSVTGIIDVARAVKKDRDLGDRLYTNTLNASLTSTAQVSLGAAAGVAAGTAVAAVTASVAAPIIVGGLVAAGAGYAVGRLAGWITN